jgi:hypothetical protein
MLIFSVSFQIDQMPEGEELGNVVVYIVLIVFWGAGFAAAQGSKRHVIRASKPCENTTWSASMQG